VNGSVATTSGVVAAVFAMVAAIAWLAGPLVAGGLGPWIGTAALLLAVSAIGGIVYATVRGVIESQLTPLRTMSEHMRIAALRPRDQITHVRRHLPAPGATVEEVAAMAASVEAFLSKVEQRHARQTAWVVAVVHDVKTPIAGAANTLGVLARAPRITGTAEAELVERMAAELRVLVTDVQRLVDAVRFERDDVEIVREPLDLVELARSAAERAAADVTGVRVRVHGSGGATGDRTLLARAVENLVANAMRYARSVVEVEVRQGLVRVTDDGPGLPAPLEVLAQPFRSEPQTVAGVVTEGGAGGIGLFLTRRVLELHGGRLVVERTDAHGTVFLAYVGRSNG